MAGAVAGLVAGAVAGLVAGAVAGLVAGAVAGLVAGAVAGLVGGLRMKDKKVVFNFYTLKIKSYVVFDRNEVI